MMVMDAPRDLFPSELKNFALPEGEQVEYVRRSPCERPANVQCCEVSASCADLVALPQKVIGRHFPRSFRADFLGDLSGRPATSIAKRSDPTSGNADRKRKVSALDRLGFEVFGEFHNRGF
jgi:hypothetical protein